MNKRFSKIESKSIKDILGNGYGKQIQAYLLRQDITNLKQEPYSLEYLYQIVNGQKSNNRLQEQILNLVEEKHKENEKLSEKRRSLLH